MTITVQHFIELSKGTSETLATLRFQQRDSNVSVITDAPINVPNDEILRLSALYDSRGQKLSLGIVSKEHQVFTAVTNWVTAAVYFFFQFGADSFELYLEKEKD